MRDAASNEMCSSIALFKVEPSCSSVTYSLSFSWYMVLDSLFFFLKCNFSGYAMLFAPLKVTFLFYAYDPTTSVTKHVADFSP